MWQLLSARGRRNGDLLEGAPSSNGGPLWRRAAPLMHKVFRPRWTCRIAPAGGWGLIQYVQSWA